MAGEEPLALGFLGSQIVTWERDPMIWPVLVEMCQVAVGTELPNPTLTGTRWLKRRVIDAFQLGRLVLVQDEFAESTGGGGAGGEQSGQQKDGAADIPQQGAPPPAEPKIPAKTWFRAKLLDEKGNPMAGEDYVLVDTDGVKRQGKLDSAGEVYIPPILPPGKCTITFPNIHLNPLKRK
jgi:hypothetical protein